MSDRIYYRWPTKPELVEEGYFYHSGDINGGMSIDLWFKEGALCPKIIPTMGYGKLLNEKEIEMVDGNYQDCLEVSNV